MSKARSTGNISNIVKASVTGVTISDGTNDLLSISSDGNLSVVGNINASTLDGIDGVSFLQTGSFNTFSSSIDTTIKNKLNGDGVISGSIQVDITNTTGYSTLSGSIATTTSGLAGRITTVEGNYATTGSNTFIGNQTITGSICTNGNIVTTGQIVAQTINVQQVTSSIVYSCGSNVFGTDINNTQTFTGSMFITGSNIRANVENTCFGGTICTTEVGFTSNVNSSISEEYGIRLNLGGSTSQYGAQFYNCGGTKVAQISATGVACLLGLQVYSTNSDPNMEFYRTTCGVGVGIGRLYWNGNDNVGTKTLYSYIQGVIEACGTTSYCSRFEVYTACNGALSRNFQLNGVGVGCFANTVCSPSFVGGTISGTSSTISNAGTVCTVTDVLTLSTLQSGGSSVCAGAGILFTGNNGATVARIYSRGNMNLNNGSDLVFQTQTSAGGGPQCTMVINGGSQSVGIGTFNPCTNFDLRVNMTTATCGTVANSFPISTFAINASDGGCRGLQIGSTSGGIGGAPIFLKVFGTSAPFAIINSSNCVGLTMDANNVSCFANTVCSPYLSTRSIEMGGSATSPSNACVGYGMFGYSGVGLGISASATGPNQGMGFFTCGDFERMRLTTSGNLGIGCTTPSYLLDVNGRTRLCGNVGIKVTPSSAGDQYLTTGDAGIAYSNSYFGTGQVRIGGGSDHASNTVFSVAPGVVTFDRPGVGGGALKIDGSGNVSINNATATAKFHAYGTTKLENYTYYGYAQSFVWQSSFNNPVQSLFTFNASAPYSQTLIKVTFIQNGVSNGYSARYVGFALAHLNPYSFNSLVTSMTAEYTNGPAAPTLSWSGQTLQITPQRATNYDGYVVFIEWGSNTNTNAVPTVTL